MISFLATPAYASDEVEDINFDYFIVPTEYQIKLVGMYMRIQDHFHKYEVDPKLNIHYGPSFDSPVVQSINENYKHSSSFFGIKNTTLVYFNEKETNWYESRMSSLEGWYNDAWLKNNCVVNTKSTCGFASARAPHPHYYHMIGSDNKSASNWMKWIAHHETVHGFQKELGLMKDNLKMNCWILEGQANALSLASFIENNEIEEIRDGQIKNTLNIIPDLFKMSNSDFVRTFKNIENDRMSCLQKGVGYYIGMMIIEYMYIKYDVQVVHEMLLSIANGNSFDGASRAYFKVSQDDLYSNAFNYIVESLKQIP